MRTTRHPIRHILSLAGMGLMLAGLFGGPASGGIRILMGIRLLGDSKIIGDSATPGGSGTLGDTSMIGRPEGIACRIATRFTRARSASCSARASGAAVNINAENTGANVKEGEPG
jgi:hypothetical protein